jgi:hypothetical protein
MRGNKCQLSVNSELTYDSVQLGMPAASETTLGFRSLLSHHTGIELVSALAMPRRIPPTSSFVLPAYKASMLVVMSQMTHDERSL